LAEPRRERFAFLLRDAQPLPAVGFVWLATTGADVDGKVAAADADADASASAAQSAAPSATKQDLASRLMCLPSAIKC
jgi:hypothetical protein